MRSGTDLLCRQENNLPWFSPENKLAKLGDVEVLLVQDSWPTNEDSIWMMKSLKVAVKIAYDTIGKSRGWKRRKTSFPFYWELTYQCCVSHDIVRGMINSRLHVEVRTKIGWPVKRLLAARVSAVLSKALSNTKYGRQATTKPFLGQANLYWGILQ